MAHTAPVGAWLPFRWEEVLGLNTANVRHPRGSRREGFFLPVHSDGVDVRCRSARVNGWLRPLSLSDTQVTISCAGSSGSRGVSATPNQATRPATSRAGTAG